MQLVEHLIQIKVNGAIILDNDNEYKIRSEIRINEADAQISKLSGD